MGVKRAKVLNITVWEWCLSLHRAIRTPTHHLCVPWADTTPTEAEDYCFVVCSGITHGFTFRKLLLPELWKHPQIAVTHDFNCSGVPWRSVSPSQTHPQFLYLLICHWAWRLFPYTDWSSFFLFAEDKTQGLCITEEHSTIELISSPWVLHYAVYKW